MSVNAAIKQPEEERSAIYYGGRSKTKIPNRMTASMTEKGRIHIVDGLFSSTESQFLD
jgi:hypothetical protein